MHVAQWQHQLIESSGFYTRDSQSLEAQLLARVYQQQTRVPDQAIGSSYLFPSSLSALQSSTQLQGQPGFGHGYTGVGQGSAAFGQAAAGSSVPFTAGNTVSGHPAAQGYSQGSAIPAGGMFDGLQSIQQQQGMLGVTAAHATGGMFGGWPSGQHSIGQHNGVLGGFGSPQGQLWNQLQPTSLLSTPAQSVPGSDVHMAGGVINFAAQQAQHGMAGQTQQQQQQAEGGLASLSNTELQQRLALMNAAGAGSGARPSWAAQTGGVVGLQSLPTVLSGQATLTPQVGGQLC